MDGGYVEAQGATTLSDLLFAIAADWVEKKNDGNWDDRVLPIVISIQNDPPPAEPSCDKPADDARCWGIRLSDTVGTEARAMSGVMQFANDFLAPANRHMPAIGCDRDGPYGVDRCKTLADCPQPGN